MKDIADIREFIASSATRDDLVICTIVRKTGSSYRGVGAQKVVARSGGSVGLLSGGCLEASIEKAARERFEELPFTLTFDMLSDDDRLLGYQTGCQGAIEVRFERVDPSVDLDVLIPHDPIRLFIVGCGADADAFTPLATNMGWPVTFIDYRRDLVERFGPLGRHAGLTDIPRFIPQGERTAVVLMTHNYESDLEILAGVFDHHIGYLGCLGPAVRFEKLKSDLEKLHGRILSPHLLSKARAPAGIFPHSRSPAEIALSIVTQIQGELVESLPEQKRPWTLILAAGESRRYGSPKALAEIDGGTFLSRAIALGRATCGDRVMVVTGAWRERIEPRIEGAERVFNENWRDGMGSSLRTGLRQILELDPAADGVFILPVDHPYAGADHLRALRDLAMRTWRCALTSSGPHAGPPAYVPREYLPLIYDLEGVHGLKSRLNPAQVIHLENAKAFQDIDTPPSVSN